jgi:hypothetical protein
VGDAPFDILVINFPQARFGPTSGWPTNLELDSFVIAKYTYRNSRECPPMFLGELYFADQAHDLG